jgi:two-component system chemotaxis sensor kinase CheA
MDDLLREFLVETNESLDVVDVELVRFEQEPNNAKILDNIFRLVHTIKGTCGFLGLPRLEALAHAAESLMSKFRVGAPVTAEAVTLILFTIDRIKELLAELEKLQREPEGADSDLIRSLEQMARQGDDVAVPSEDRSPRPGEVTAEELERVFRETPGPAVTAHSDTTTSATPAGRQTRGRQGRRRQD